MNLEEPILGNLAVFWEKSPVPALQCSPDGICLHANEAALKFFELDLGALGHASLQSFAAQNDGLIIADCLKSAAQSFKPSEPVTVTFGCGEKSMRQCLLRTQAVASKDHAKHPIVIFVQLEQASLPIRTYASSLEADIRPAQDAIILLNSKFRVQVWNQGATKLLGWETQEVMDQEITEFAFEDSPDTQAFLESLIKNGDWAGQMGVTTKAGECKSVEAYFYPLGDHQGVLLVLADMAEKHLMAECLVRSQRLESLRTLAAGVAHDMNNVFTPISMAVELLGCVDLPKDELNDLLKTVEGSLHRGSTIIKQLVALGKGAEGKRIVFQPKHIIREVINIARKSFPPDTMIQSDVLRDLWEIRGDQIQFHHLLMRLLLNAKDVMPEGGCIFVDTANAEVDEQSPLLAHALQPGRYVQLTIIDEGEGMEEADRIKVMDATVTTRPRAMGGKYDMNQVRNIVKSFHGHVLCESKPGSGIKFSIFIPAVPEKKQ